ncbi:GTP pyrophosphokinase family protein [Leucobacter coleopterorum]|uniref:GTP pyrophosphokinase family protein n=1 Tax=Leucobacter coleopterorum TaxID=2714933 RepID=A0ABX6JXZ1_9MICO|nr:GTP pyrophosphokinase family protein [Leucobacter coleopterorum]QIM19097.1 GTP pyrophosphokinase family protein [Leucobacter coleopterorum]
MSNPAVDPLGDEITISASAMRALGDQLQRFLLEYRFAMQEVETKLAILQEEFLHMHEYNPIEHVSSRVKSVDSLLEKLERRGLVEQLERSGLDSNFDVIRGHIHDVAGVRVTCAFIRDVYRLFDLLTRQDDITVLEVKDYIKTPKENGYQSLHTIISVPVFLSTGRVNVPVEVQFRTIAMDFWATLEHKIYYKYDRQVPDSLIGELKNAADTAAELDTRMERLHAQLHGDPGLTSATVETSPAVRRIHNV